MDYSKQSIEDLEKAQKKLDKVYNDKLNECCSKGMSWEDFMEEAKSEKEELYFISKYIRLKKEPTISFDTERGGEEFTLEEFKKICTTSNMFTDSDGFGVYATEKGVSDIEVIPSDFVEGIYRTDFSHILWYNK
jgi:hypothetical protein